MPYTRFADKLTRLSTVSVLFPSLPLKLISITKITHLSHIHVSRILKFISKYTSPIFQISITELQRSTYSGIRFNFLCCNMPVRNHHNL